MNIVKNTKYEVLTADGWKDFEGISILEKNCSIIIKLQNTSIECTLDHLIAVDHFWVKAEDLEIGDYISTKNGLEEIINIEIKDETILVYDLVEVSDNNEFFANDIVVHNSCALLMLDELAFISNSDFDTFFSSVYPTIASSKEAKIIISSTPNGLNHFYKLWTEAVEGISEYVYQEINWWDPPGRDAAFRTKMIAEIGLDRWMQEFECQFLGAAGAIIKSEILKSLPGKRIIEKLYDGKFKIFEKPVPNNLYIALCDVSEGVGKDSSTIQVIDITKLPFKQVAVFKDDTIKSNLFHLTIDQVGRMYNNALVIVESNAIGREVLNNLFYDVEYENLFFDDGISGLRTTRTIKNVGCSEMKYLIENMLLELVDLDTIGELSNFIRYADGKIAAKKDHHDDLVMPLVHFGYFTGNKKLFNLWFEDVDTGMINKNEINKITESFMPFGWKNEGYGIEQLDDFSSDTEEIYSIHRLL